MSLSIGLTVLMRCVSVSKILHDQESELPPSASTCKPNYESLYNVEDFVSACLNEYGQYSENEARNIYQKLKLEASECECKKIGVYAIILAIAKQALRIDGISVCCKHSEILCWRQTVHQLGQSIFICAFLAHEDIRNRFTRTKFDYSLYAKTDNLRLRNMLSQGIADNHFHLKGSAPAFMISWVCLMNHIENRNNRFGFKSKKMERLFFQPALGDKNLSLCEAVERAAAIRLFLWRKLNGQDADDKWLIRCPLGALTVSELQQEVNAERIKCPGSLDYILDTERRFTGTSTMPSAYSAIAGEHCFLYRVFYAIYDKNPSFATPKNLEYFYAYLLIFVRLRAELVQSNKAVGFYNFMLYQDRKELFLEGFPNYGKALVRTALHSVLDNKSIRSLELRVAPKNSPYEIRRSLKQIYEAFDIPDAVKAFIGSPMPRDPRAFFVLHLVKQPDAPSNDLLRALVACRHASFRKQTVSTQILSIVHLFQACDQYARSIYGIDACNQEIGCRPEVFAPDFRYARAAATPSMDLFPSAKAPPVLRITYHVGEDFLDVVDGLRAIDEAIRFFELRHGDRLGHALALGVDAEDWYGYKGRKVFLPRQDLLDNAVWFYKMLQQYGIDNAVLKEMLYDTFRKQFYIVYGKWLPLAMKNQTFSLDTYYESWCLRGDKPELYMNSQSKGVFDLDLMLAGRADYLRTSTCRAIRENNVQARHLMQQYHYNPMIKQTGAEIEEFSITAEYASAVTALQKAMKQEIAHLGISIETNPTSNFMIGTFHRYDKHPILSFNDQGLLPNENSEQLHVSINTDDQGVFDTDIENEFALMACALENARDVCGREVFRPAHVYQWLDTIRRMGLEQSFKGIAENLRGAIDDER